jgi:hypothetical protein
MSKHTSRKHRVLTSNNTTRPPTGRADEWAVLWRKFLKDHNPGPWIKLDEAAYVLPKEVVRELAARRGFGSRLPPILDANNITAETDFRNLCQGFGRDTIGVYRGSPIQYPLFAPLQIAVDDLNVKQKARLKRSHQQQLTYAGSLVFHPLFQEELHELRAKWQKFPDKPAAGPFWGERLARKFQVSQSSLPYYQAYDKFCARWHLAMLVSWDLPCPLGPIEGMTLEELVSQFGPSLRVDYYPPYMDTPTDSIELKAGATRTLAKLFPDIAVLPPPRGLVGQGKGPSENATALRIWLVEKSLERRYGHIHGITACLNRGFSKLLKITEDQVRRLRRIYTTLNTTYMPYRNKEG